MDVVSDSAGRSAPGESESAHQPLDRQCVLLIDIECCYIGGMSAWLLNADWKYMVDDGVIR